jgi:membrane-bound lytic murein transglycosylase D
VATRSAVSAPDTLPIKRLITILAIGWLIALPSLSGVALAQEPAQTQEPDPFAVPPQLEPDVRFWIRVYTEVTTEQGLLHDSWNLALVYEVLRFDPDASLASREQTVAQAKARYSALLHRFADGDVSDLSAHERRILGAFGEGATRQQFLDAIDRIRFQLGQADRFHEGLIRSQLWESHIARTLRERGVPAEIAALPHVESSFNPAAYSRVGAAGLWQFMPTTARRFMRVDGLVDERLDPYRATEAAANLLLYNYNLLGTWPLAVTAYNHGPAGLRHAQEDLGTSDIAIIVKRYQGATFGFASRNFYVAFLAALEVDRNPEAFFGPIQRLPETHNTTIELPDYIPADALAKAFKVDPGALRVLNPALRPPIWEKQRFVPRGYSLRLPGSIATQEIAAAWGRLPPAQRFLAQRGDSSYRVRREETLQGVAGKLHVTVPRLLASNGWSAAPVLQRGQVLRVPLPQSRAEKGTPEIAEAVLATTAPPPEVAALPPSSLPAPAPAGEPVSERQTQGEALLPAAAPTAPVDPTDYAVSADDTVVVRSEETLGHYAEWSGTGIATLREMNHLRNGATVGLGRKIKLDFSHVGAAQFTATRVEFHRQLQEDFFAAHRIAGTATYTIRHGDSLWTVAQQHGELPTWLVTQYNPDVDFSTVQAGASVTLPQVEAINRQ